MHDRFLRLSTAGMRGIVGDALNPAVVVDYVSALGTYLKGGAVAVGCDTRHSSTLLKHASIGALMACGCQVIDAGVCPAPLMHFLAPHLHLAGGVLIGGGHHQAGWNAIIPINAQGAYFNRVQTQTLLDIYHGRLYLKATYQNFGTSRTLTTSVTASYLKTLAHHLNVEAIRKANLKVVVDCCNGAGSELIERWADILGVNLIVINNENSGDLPHDPEPRPRTGRQVKALIAPLQADVGFVMNSDVSRISVVTDRGDTPSEEVTFALVAKQVLSRNGATSALVTNVCSSRAIDDLAAQRQVAVHKTAVGQAHVIDRMLETKALLGGDGSGSIAFGNGVNGYDGFSVIGTILEAMAVRGLTSGNLLRELPDYFIVKKFVRCQGFPYRLLVQMKSVFSTAKACDETDGLRFDWDDGWLHLRVSATEPILRVIAEWKTREGAIELADRAVVHAERLIFHG